METTTVTPATTTPATPIPAPVESHVVEFKRGTYSHPVTLTRLETQAKGEKANIAYWGFDTKQFGATATEQLTTLGKLLTEDVAVEMLLGKVNVNLKAAQLDAGKDKYSMADKATYARDYIIADFGINSKGGGAAIKALKETNAKQSDILIQLVQLHTKFATATPDEAAKLLVEIQQLTAKASQLVAQG